MSLWALCRRIQGRLILAAFLATQAGQQAHRVGHAAEHAARKATAKLIGDHGGLRLDGALSEDTAVQKAAVEQVQVVEGGGRLVAVAGSETEV